jgi:hypothetical protein
VPAWTRTPMSGDALATTAHPSATSPGCRTGRSRPLARCHYVHRSVRTYLCRASSRYVALKCTWYSPGSFASNALDISFPTAFPFGDIALGESLCLMSEMSALM